LVSHETMLWRWVHSSSPRGLGLSQPLPNTRVSQRFDSLRLGLAPDRE